MITGTHTTGPGTASRSFPDAQFVRKELPIRDVAQALGLEPDARRLRCPIDRTHWARFWLRRNSVKCFACRHRPWSTIDLVMASLDMNVGDALRWLDEQFKIPRRQRRVTRSRWGKTRPVLVDYPACQRPHRLMPDIRELRRAPSWPSLTHGARALAAVLLESIPWHSPTLATTYREIQRKTGIGNRGTLKSAFGQLATIGMIETAIEATHREVHGRFADQTIIRLTWGSQAFQSWLSTPCTATKYLGSEVNLVKSPNGQETEPGVEQESERGLMPPKPLRERVLSDPVVQAFIRRFNAEIIEMKDLRPQHYQTSIFRAPEGGTKTMDARSGVL